MFRSVPTEEVYRKLLHGLVIIFPVAIFYSPSVLSISRESIVKICLLLLILSIFIEVLRLLNISFGEWFYSKFGAMLREEEKKHLTGATYIAGAIFICAWLSTTNESLAVCSFLGLTLFVLGDAVAALAGKSFGKIRIGKKTLEGAIACFLLCFMLSYFIFPQLPKVLEGWGTEISFVQAIVIGLSVSLLELFPIKLARLHINDNLYVPVLVTYISYFIR